MNVAKWQHPKEVDEQLDDFDDAGRVTRNIRDSVGYPFNSVLPRTVGAGEIVIRPAVADLEG